MEKKYTDIDIMAVFFGCIIAILIFNGFKPIPEYAKRDWHLTQRQVMVIWESGYIVGWSSANESSKSSESYITIHERDSTEFDNSMTIK